MKTRTKKVLSYIKSNGETATTYDVTSETELSDNDTVRYEFSKLEEKGLVKLDSANDGWDTTRATLSEEGEQKYNDDLAEVEQLAKDTAANYIRLVHELEEKDVIEDKEEFLKENQ